MDDHRSQIEDRPLPDDVASAFENALGLASRPATLGEWIDLTAARLDAAGVTFGVEDMCLTDESPHSARIGEETRYYACVLDALLLPCLRDEPDEVVVQTRSPVSGTTISGIVTTDGITANPTDAVLSLGIAEDTDSPEDRDGVLANGTAQFCPYINAFADIDEYAQWADETEEGVTMQLPLEDGFALVAALSDRLPTATA